LGRGDINMAKKRDTYKYTLKDGNEIKYIGITDDPDRRIEEHSKDKNFSHMKIEGQIVTRKSAEKWEENRLETYRKGHKGKNPKYNKTDK